MSAWRELCKPTRPVTVDPGRVGGICRSSLGVYAGSRPDTLGVGNRPCDVETRMSGSGGSGGTGRTAADADAVIGRDERPPVLFKPRVAICWIC